MNTKTLFSSATDNWATPQWFFDKLNEKYKFDLDPCADDFNNKCPNYYTKAQNGLNQEWGGRVFCNPPYGRAIKDWVKKCYDSRNSCEVIVLLIPARTDTEYFHEYIYGKAEIVFIRGRLKFGNATNSAPFPSMLVTYKPDIKE